jgi:hypothetical protein
MLELKPDYAESKRRIDAFWEREIIDRPVVQFSVPKPPEEWVPLPVSEHESPTERWMDSQFQAELALARLSNAEYIGDTLPIAFPNLGPEVFSAFYGCPIHFGDYGTSWTDPVLDDWSEVDRWQFDPENVYLKKLHEMTDALLAAGRGKFITGMTDWHPGGDAIAAFRDPANLAMDMILHPAEVRALLDRLEADYFRVYDVFYEKLRAADQPITTWLPLICDGRYYVPSNDFSIMISSEMFDEVFLPGIVRECQFLDRSIYHLDGPGALRHLDSLLDIPELDAVQWVFGAGNEGYHRWIDVYQRVQAAGKGVQVMCALEEITSITDTLDPHGLYISISGAVTREVARGVVRSLETWCGGRVF